MGRRSGWQALRGFGIRSLEDLSAMPADVLKLHDRLAGPGRDQRLARELIHGPDTVMQPIARLSCRLDSQMSGNIDRWVRVPLADDA